MDEATMSAVPIFFVMLKRDVLLGYRRLSEVANPLLFFLMVTVMFPLGLGPDPKALAVIAPGVLWVVALLACLMATDGLFRSDYDDGSLEQCVLQPASLYFQVLGKVFAHWLLTGFPLMILSPVLGLMLQLPQGGYLPLIFSLAIGTLSLSFIGAIGAALTVSLRRGGLLMSLIILPLYVPVLIFGASSVQAGAMGMAFIGQLAILGSMTMLALVLAPLAICEALKLNLAD
jgi:heme exporter protein B